ncbi:hypothetical protein D3C81_1977350 [compost metagenome]
MLAGDGLFVIFALLFSQNKLMLAVIGIFDRTPIVVGNQTVVTVSVFEIRVIEFFIASCTVPVCLIRVRVCSLIFSIGNQFVGKIGLRGIKALFN